MGGGVARTDQSYGVDVGRYNTWRVRGSFSETPHVFTSTYRSLWDGVGSDALTLRGLRPGGTTDANTTQANMLLAISSAPASDLELTRKKSRARFDLTLPANWKAFASYTRERREGSRPFGAVFGGGGGGGNVEIPESIDYNTQDVLAGLQFANALTERQPAGRGVVLPERHRHDDVPEPVVHHDEYHRGRAGDDLYAGAVRPLPEQRLLQREGRSSPGSSRSFSRAGSPASCRSPVRSRTTT